MKRANKFSQLVRLTLLNTTLLLIFILLISLTVQDADSSIVNRKGFRHRQVRDAGSDSGETKPDGDGGHKHKLGEAPKSEKDEQTGVDKPIQTGAGGEGGGGTETGEGPPNPEDGTESGNDTETTTIKPEDLKEEKSSLEKFMDANETSSSEVRNNLNFNSLERPPWATAMVNHSVVEKMCNESNPCLASNLVLPICASDESTYLNPGIFRCAQKCNAELEITQVGACPKHVMPPMPPSTTMPPPTTLPPKHKTPNTRLKVRGILIQPLLRLIGLHVHDDGGFYLADEKKHEGWWNI